MNDTPELRDDGQTVPEELRGAGPESPASILDAAANAEQSDPAQEALRREMAAFRAALIATTPRIAVTPVFLGANALVFAAMVVTGAGFFEPSGQALKTWGANYGPLTLSGEPWRLLTSAFVHIGIVHIAVNMWALWNVGRAAERLLGNVGFAALYLLAALAGSVASLAWHPDIVSAGASGALFGLFGALLAFLARHRRSLPRPVLASLGRSSAICVVANVFLGATVSGIDNAAHLGGLACGFLAGLVLAKPLGPEPAAKGLARSAAVLLAGGLALGAGWMAIPRGVVEAQRAMEAYERDEAAAVEAYNALLPLVKSGKLTDAEWADRLEREVLPIWRRAAERLSAPEGLPPGTYERLAKLCNYAQLRVQSIELRIRGLRTGSEEDLRASDERRQRAEALYAPSGGGKD